MGLIFNFNFRCPQETCDECIEVFEEYKFILPYKCDEECGNCNLCEGDYQDSVSVCKYCVDGPDNCSSLCKTGKATCISCQSECFSKR